VPRKTGKAGGRKWIYAGGTTIAKKYNIVMLTADFNFMDCLHIDYLSLGA